MKKSALLILISLIGCILSASGQGLLSIGQSGSFDDFDSRLPFTTTISGDLGFDSKKLIETIENAEKLESNSNQILDFTREIKSIDEDSKKKIVESLWNIIYSDDQSDIYESNLMRRLTGLLYLDKKIVGDLKEKAKLKKK